MSFIGITFLLFKAILREKDKEIEALKLQVTLLQNHVNSVKDTLDEKVDIGAVWKKGLSPHRRC